MEHQAPRTNLPVTKKHQRDLIEDHHEWVEHAYNPGYWINRVTSLDLAWWRWDRKHNKLNGFLGMIVFGLAASAFIYPAVEEGKSRNISFLTVMAEDLTIPVTLFAILMFLASLAFFQTRWRFPWIVGPSPLPRARPPPSWSGTRWARP